MQAALKLASYGAERGGIGSPLNLWVNPDCIIFSLSFCRIVCQSTLETKEFLHDCLPRGVEIERVAFSNFQVVGELRPLLFLVCS